jgi:ribosomal protein L29
MANDELDELFALHRTEIVKLKAELAEARAQIAANWDEMGAANRKLQTELFEARAQIAAKDAALRNVRKFFESEWSCTSIVEMIDAALAAPARETK